MGYLSLDGYETEFDDRTLSHLHLVIVSKLRKGESFALSWKEPQSTGGGRTSTWVNPATRIRFHFDGSRSPTLNRDWLLRLAESASSSRGLVVEREDVLDAGQPQIIGDAKGM
jgi:hypothetical protein